MSRTTEITPEKIMQLTNNGYDIFNWELGHIPRKNIPSPLRCGDTVPSFQVKQTKSGIWTFRDYGGDQKSGNAISFVQEKYGLNFPEAIQKIVQDLGLKEKSRVYKPIIKNIQPKITNYVPLIEFNKIPFSSKGAAYWNSYHLPCDFLQANNVFEVGLWAIDKKIQKKTEDEVTFVYWAEDIQKTKILRIGPNVPKENKWRTNIPNDHLWYFDEEINKNEKFVITKSNKDALIFKKLGIQACATQSENGKILEKTIERVREKTNNFVVVFGSDKQGMEQMNYIKKKKLVDIFYTPIELVEKGINDPAEYVKEYGLLEFYNYLEENYFFCNFK